MRLLHTLVTDAPFTGANSKPAHSTKLVVDHEAQGVRQIRLKGDRAEDVSIIESKALFEYITQACNK